MAIDFEEAARDCRRIGFLRQIDDIVARCRRRGRVAGADNGASTAEGWGSALPVRLR
jgi:hypothetical protein